MTADTPAAAPTAEREALNCPFCGLPAYVEADFGREWWVQCQSGHSTGILHENAAAALEEWNRRAALSPPVAAPPADPLLGQALQALVRYANACDADAPTVAVIQALEARIDAAPVFHLRSFGDVTADELERLTAAPPAAWLHEDGERVVSARTKRDMVKDGGASASAAKGYSIALGPMDGAPPAASGVEALWVEATARAVYAQWQHLDGWVPWVDGGNSLQQDEARRVARAHLSTALGDKK